MPIAGVSKRPRAGIKPPKARRPRSSKAKPLDDIGRQRVVRPIDRRDTWHTVASHGPEAAYSRER